MRLTSLSICGFRAFNDSQTLDLSDPIAVFEGPNGSGKTSIGEAMEWLLYGRTLKRTKGDALSKREYTGCYRNVHFSGATAYVEAEVEDSSGKPRRIRRELKADETSVLSVDGAAAQNLTEFGIDHMHDRPLILQHTLQDFIFMRPKARYEVLSAMLGLEPLIALRSAVEAAKTNFGNRIPQRVSQARNKSALLVTELRQEHVLVPVVTAIEFGRLAAARQHLVYVAQGLVTSGAAQADLLSALKATKAAEERSQLDWGRFSAQVIGSPPQNQAVMLLSSLDQHIERIRQHLRNAAAVTAPEQAPAREQDPQRRQFYDLGLHLVDSTHPATCPFCAAESLTPERLAALREAVAETIEGQSAISKALAEVRALVPAVATQVGEVKKLVPTQPQATDVQRIQDIVGAGASAYLASSQELSGHLERHGTAYAALEESQKAVEESLSFGRVPAGADDLGEALARYKVEVNALPAFINAYAATYSQLDPAIRAGLSSAADVKKIERTISALERWKDVQVSQAFRDVERIFTDLVGDIRTFIKRKQKEVLATRDQEIKDWYAMLNPASDVAYDGMTPGTDNLELRARTYSKTMFAAPNLSTSQLNCVGIAIYLACATRKGTPFKTLLIDDPLQSMDDEHTEAFKKQVIERLLTHGYHVIVLTHMQLLANDVESLYRNRGAVLYKMSHYSRSGPSIDWKGPQLVRLLESVRRNKDGNEQYRQQATLNLRIFIERFAKDLYKAQTGGTISRRYEDRNWSQLKDLLKRCKDFDAADEPKIEDTHTFTSRHLHTDDRMPQPVPSGSQITSHYSEMSDTLNRYKPILGIP